MLTYKLRLHPTKTQVRRLEETLETCRRLYNWMPDDRIRVEVRGESIIRVFGSKVTAPISSSFEISLADILKR
jgi:transposase